MAYAINQGAAAAAVQDTVTVWTMEFIDPDFTADVCLLVTRCPEIVFRSFSPEECDACEYSRADNGRFVGSGLMNGIGWDSTGIAEWLY